MAWEIGDRNVCNSHTKTDKDSMYLYRFCRHKPKWKVEYSWAVRYYCTRHKNLYGRGSLSIVAL